MSLNPSLISILKLISKNSMKKKSEDVQALGSFFNFLHLIPNSG